MAEPKKPMVRVAGVIRDGEQPNMFVPNNQPEIGQWFYVDIPAMARVMGLPEDVTYMEAVAISAPDVEGRKKFPLPKESDSFLKASVMPQDHLKIGRNSAQQRSTDESGNRTQLDDRLKG